MKKRGLVMLILLIAVPASWAADYTFDIPAKEEKAAPTLQWNGNLDGRYTLFHPQDNSPIYGLQFAADERDADYLTQYQLDWYLNGDYQTKDMGFHLKTHATYLNDADDLTLDLFELYGNLNLSLSSALQAGKIRYNWGKGYAFNPSGFVNPVKDPENPGASQAGTLSLNFETIKSFTSDVLKTAALTVIVLPPQVEVNERFGEPEDTSIAAKLYLMLWNLDVDLMGYYGKDHPTHIGADVALNLTTAFEVHGEVAYFQDMPKNMLLNQQLVQTEEDGFAYLIGLRWLNQWDVTTILEYYHTDVGLTEEEFGDYLDVLQRSLDSGNEEQIRCATGVIQNFKGSNLMQDYLYLNLQKPEPFDWLYFTPSATVMYNLHDQSALLSLNLSYKPVNNFEVLVKPTMMLGSDDSEYGSQQFSQQVETWLRFYF
jgi:hypothetical protein